MLYRVTAGAKRWQQMLTVVWFNNATALLRNRTFKQGIPRGHPACSALWRAPNASATFQPCTRLTIPKHPSRQNKRSQPARERGRVRDEEARVPAVSDLITGRNQRDLRDTSYHTRTRSRTALAMASIRPWAGTRLGICTGKSR
jgi:hypothetical protein